MAMRGIVFTVDAAIALLLVMASLGLFAILNFETTSHELTYEQLHFSAQDLIQVMAVLKVSDVDNEPVIADLLASGRLIEAHRNKSVVDVVAEFWSGDTPKNMSIAANITQTLFSDFVPDNMDWAFMIDNAILANSSAIRSTDDIVVSRRFASGFTESRPTTGCFARANVEAVKGKRDSSYAFFGGFVGEGNMTHVVRDVPPDANVSEIYMEMNVIDNFTLFVNGFNCGQFNTFGSLMNVSNFTLTPVSHPLCVAAISKGGINVFSLNFSSPNITKHYIGGGFIRVTYSTNRLVTKEGNITKYNFPGIDGFINLYSSFYIPGNIYSMDMHLKFRNNYTTYFRIAGTNVMTSSGSNATQSVNYSNAVLSSLLDYNSLSSKTVPIRMGIEAIGQAGTGNSDVILITDTSGSMGWCVSNNNNCNPPNERIDLARDLGKSFANIILSTPGNRVGLVTYSSSATNEHDLSSNESSLNSTIDGFGASGNTCIGCAVRMARMMLQEQSNDSRQKFMVVMSDGLANMRVHSTDLNRTTCCTYGYWWNRNYYCPSPHCGSNLRTVCGTSFDQTAADGAVASACYANQTLNNFTAYSVGFGPISTCPQANQTLQDIASCGNGLFFASDNQTELEQIYQLLANTILYQSYQKQVTDVIGDISTWLSNDSYIEFGYSAAEAPLGYNEISFAQEGARFGGCNGTLFVPENMDVSDVKLVSYSGDYWADRVSVSNKNNSGTGIYVLEDFGTNYEFLGDPYAIHVPLRYVNKNDSNEFSVRLGVNPITPKSACSGKDKLIYIIRVSAFSSSQGLFPECFGHNVSVYYDSDRDGNADGMVFVTIGENAPGFRKKAVNVSDLNTSEDGVANAFVQLLDQLNFYTIPSNKNSSGSITNPIDIQITPEVKFSINIIGGVPYMWGPAEMEVVLWRKG